MFQDCQSRKLTVNRSVCGQYQVSKTLLSAIEACSSRSKFERLSPVHDHKCNPKAEQ